MHKIGLVAAVGIVAGNMMGSGIALLPKSLASLGSISIFGWIISIIGVLSLAYVFARLGTINPQSGGPVAYAGEVAPILGYQSGVLYYHSNWIGNLAIAVAGVSYLSYFIPVLNNSNIAGITTIAIIWLFALVNIIGGINWISKLITTGIILMIIPVFLTATVGWFHFSSETFMANWNTSGNSDIITIINSIILCLWSFIGLESSSVEANLVKNPKRIVPLSTFIGTIIAASLYILSSTAIMGMFSANTLAHSGAPFAESSGKILGQWSSSWVSFITAFVCLASLSSWMMLTAEAGARSSNEGYFPKAYGERTKEGILKKGVLIQATQMTALMLLILFFKSTSDASFDLFGTLITIAGLTVLLPYFYTCLNLRSRTELSVKNILPLTTCFIGCLFCMSAFYGAKGDGLAECLLISIVILFFYVRWRSKNKNKCHFPSVSKTSIPDADVNEVVK